MKRGVLDSLLHPYLEIGPFIQQRSVRGAPNILKGPFGFIHLLSHNIKRCSVLGRSDLVVDVVPGMTGPNSDNILSAFRALILLLLCDLWADAFLFPILFS